MAHNQNTRYPLAAVVASNYDNDLGLGADGKIETGFPLHRDTFTGGAFYRESQVKVVDGDTVGLDGCFAIQA